MKTVKYSHERESGFTSLPMLFGILALPVILLGVTAGVNQYLARQARAQIRKEVNNLGSLIQMMYSNRANCSQNIPNFAWGDNLQKFEQRTDKEKLKFIDPMVASAGHQTILGAEDQFAGLFVDKIDAGAPIRLHPTDAAYLIEFQITAHIGGSIDDDAYRRTATVPFYVRTDAAGKFTECFATAYTDASTKKTIEDDICGTQMGPGYRFRPSNSTCSTEMLLITPSATTATTSSTSTSTTTQTTTTQTTVMAQ